MHCGSGWTVRSGTIWLLSPGYDRENRVKTETVVTAISFTCFGVLLGWILGTQQGTAVPVAAPTAAATTQQSNAPSAPPLDLQRVAELEKQAAAQPSNAVVRVDLGNVYYDAGRFDLAVPWYEAGLKLDPKNVTASTDLAVCYYNVSAIDKALAQLDHSLTVDPKHAKTLLNQGIIRAFGKSDLQGAMASWQRVVAVAPNTEEARRAQQALDDLKSAHPGGAPAAAPTNGRSGGRGRP